MARNTQAGMVAHPRDYPWSRYGFNAQGEAGLNTDWLVPNGEYLRMGRDAAEWQGAYRLLFRAAL